MSEGWRLVVLAGCVVLLCVLALVFADDVRGTVIP